MTQKILVVEDEALTREGIIEYLQYQGYAVWSAEDGQQALDLFSRVSFDLLLLDIMLPKKNGFELLKEIRKTSTVPVLMLTAMTDEQTQILSFDAQADDYLPKPFSLVVLEKRVAALLRRTQQNQATIKERWQFQTAMVDFDAYTATLNQVPVDIKPKEIQLLKFLVAHPGQVLSRAQILDALYHENEAPFDRVVDVYIKNLRKKLALTCIHTVKGIGYKYEEER